MDNLPFPHFLNGGTLNEPASEVDSQCYLESTNIEDSNNFSDEFLDNSASNKCEICDFESDNLVDFQNHQCDRKSARDLSSTCTYCGKSFPSKSGKSNLKRHIKQVHEKVRLECDFCDKDYTDLSALRYHIKKEHQNENLADRGRYLSALRYHIKIEHQKENLSNNRRRSKSMSKNENVTISEPAMEIKQEPIENISESTEIKKEPLEDVEKISKNATGAKRGKYKKNKSKKEEINIIHCELCDSVFTGKNIRQCESNLKIHIKTIHEGERNFSCYICNKAFWHQWHLRRHINAYHKKLKSVPCDVCSKSFDPDYLKNHKCRAHKCDFCEKGYTKEHLLQGHMKKCPKYHQGKNVKDKDVKPKSTSRYDYWQIEGNEQPKDNMISLNGTAKTSQLNNGKRKECDFCGNLILDDIRKHLPFVDICEPGRI